MMNRATYHTDRNARPFLKTQGSISRADVAEILSLASNGFALCHRGQFELGMSDHDIGQALEQQFGFEGGVGTESLLIRTQKAGLRIWGRRASDKLSPYVLLFRGQQTIAAVRELYKIRTEY